MKRTRRWIAALIALAVAGSAPALASVVGSWTVDGKATVKVNVQGFGRDKQSGPAMDFFEFFGDGSFQMIDMGGTWTQNGAQFTVLLSPQDIESFFETAFAGEGLSADVTVTRNRFKGKEVGGDDAIKGTLALKLDLYIYTLGAPGTVKAKFKFRGSRVVLAQGAAAAPERAAGAEGALRDVLRAILSGALQKE